MRDLDRRAFLSFSLAAGCGVLAVGCDRPGAHGAQEADPDVDWWMPDESGPHARTWMAFAARRSIWGRRLVPKVERDLARLALAIAEFEPVSMLVSPDHLKTARDLVGHDVELIEHPLDDLWIRDTGPTFVLGPDGQRAAVDFNFNGWGNKQTHKRDAKVAAFIAKQANVPVLKTELVLEGGSIEVDGHGTALITESSVLIDNRNPGVTKAEFEEKLSPLLGLDKIIWLPGVRGQDITDGHIDFYARFAKPGTALVGHEPDPESPDHAVTRRHRELLKDATDAVGNRLTLVALSAPTALDWDRLGDDFAAGYIGFYVCNGAVILQTFGDDAADRAAIDTVAATYPDRKVVPLRLDALAAGGGSAHCATLQEPAAGER